MREHIIVMIEQIYSRGTKCRVKYKECDTRFFVRVKCNVLWTLYSVIYDVAGVKCNVLKQ